MASNLMSRWRTSNNVEASIYETIEQHENDSGSSDLEQLPSDGLKTTPNAGDLESGIPRSFAGQRPSRPSNPARGSIRTRTRARQSGGTSVRPRWLPAGQDVGDNDDADDDVPASLLIEGNQLGMGPGSFALPPPPSLMGEGREHNRSYGSQPDDHSPSRHPDSGLGLAPPPTARYLTGIANAAPREQAMWRWTNVVNLDNFLNDVYDYFLYHGFWSIMLRRVLNLITVAFLVGSTVFLTQCVDYQSIRRSTRTSEILVQSCTRQMGFLPNALLWFVVLVWIWKVFTYIVDLRRLRHLHDFYLHLLDISDVEIQSISWPEVVSRLMALRDSHPKAVSNTSAKTRRFATNQSKERMDAHDIANRLMRKENYVIAMINKDILDMTLPIPFLRNRQLFTRTLEWNINYCIFDFVFNNRGQIRRLFLMDKNRNDLIEGLRRRFLFAGAANLLIAPALIFFLLLRNFFTHFNEYQKNPASIGSRDYNVLARWKFREFNEVAHLFKKRINMSHPFASRYVDQFPKDKTIQAARFTTLISGALVSVLGLATLLDQENFLSFEITHGRTTIFYLGLFGGIWAVARGLIPEETMVYEPEYAMQEVIDFTHYEPAHWQDRLHTIGVKKEFEQLYQMKILMFVEEILSMVFTPFVLWFSLPKCSDRIIDFFREFTVHVDGIGYVCSFAEFNLHQQTGRVSQKGRGVSGAIEAPPADPRDDYFASKDHKMEQSYWGFMNDYSRNPKAGPQFHYPRSRRQLNMPPPMPGLPSPTIRAGAGPRPATVGGQQSSLFSPRRTTGFDASASHIQAHGSDSPLQSLLLDPHHQPSASGFQSSRAAPMGGLQARSQRRGVGHPEDLIEEDEPMQNDEVGITHSEGELGSWKYEQAKGDSSEEENEEAAIQEDAGVLGLIRKLQKTQTEKNRAATGI